MLIFLCPIEGRKLKNCITALLKSQSATQVIRQNYTQSYTMSEGKLQKVQAKLLFILPNPGMEAKIMSLVLQQIPQAQQLSQAQILS